MTSGRHTRDDVIDAAGRLFAERGYHGTSMRDLGKALGLHGSSLYSHVSSKEDLLVEVVQRGAELFQRSADAACEREEQPRRRLRELIRGHVDVILDHLDESRTFLNEARALDASHRRSVIEARDRYERAFRDTVAAGVSDGTFGPDVDPKMTTIFLLSVLNAIDRWYRPDGALDRDALAEEILLFTIRGIEP